MEAREQQIPRLSIEVDRLSNRLRTFEEREAALVAEAAAGAAALKEQRRRADALEKEQRRMTAQHEERMEEEKTMTRLALERLRNELTGSLEEQQKMKRTEEMAQRRCSKCRLSALSEDIVRLPPWTIWRLGARLRTLEHCLRRFKDRRDLSSSSWAPSYLRRVAHFPLFQPAGAARGEAAGQPGAAARLGRVAREVGGE